MSEHYLDKDWCDDLQLDLSKGRFLVIYSDEGPAGICGQSMDTTCPHVAIRWFASREAYIAWREKTPNAFRNGRKPRETLVQVGEFSSPGRVTVMVHDEKECG